MAKNALGSTGDSDLILDQPRVDQEDSTCHRVTKLVNHNY